MIEIPQGDTIKATRRKHWLMLLIPLIPLLLLAPLPLVLYAWLAHATFSLGTTSITFPGSISFLGFASSAWLLLLCMRAGHLFTDYYLDIWTLTNNHLVGTDQRTLFHRHSAIVRIERIQDITVEVNGIIETFFEFGDLHVQSAGQSREFVMRGVADPHPFREMILHEQQELVRNSPHSSPLEPQPQQPNPQSAARHPGSTTQPMS